MIIEKTIFVFYCDGDYVSWFHLKISNLFFFKTAPIVDPRLSNCGIIILLSYSLPPLSATGLVKYRSASGSSHEIR